MKLSVKGSRKPFRELHWLSLESILAVALLILILGLHSARLNSHGQSNDGQESKEKKVDTLAFEVALSPDGRLLATAGFISTLLWEVSTGQELLWFEGGQSVAFSPDGRVLAVGDINGMITLWELSSGKQLFSLDTRGTDTAIAISSDGTLMASATGGMGTKPKLLVWDIANKKVLKSLGGYTEQISVVAISPDGRWVASGGGGERDKEVGLWKLDSQPKALDYHNDTVLAVAFSPDGKLLATGGKDKKVILLDVATGKTVKVIKGHRNWVNAIAFSPDGRLMATGSKDKTVIIWDVATGARVNTLKGHPYEVSAVCFLDNGNVLLSVSVDFGDSRRKKLMLSEVATGSELPLESLKLLPGQVASTFGENAGAKTEDTSQTAHAEAVNALAFSPKGDILASGSTDKTIKLWEVSSGQAVRTLTGHPKALIDLVFNPEGSMLASASTKAIKLWEVSSGQEVGTLTGHSDSIMNIAFSPDGQLLASGSTDKTIKLWDVSTRSEKHTLEYSHEIRSIAFSPNGDMLVSGNSDMKVALWEVATGHQLRAMEGHSRDIMKSDKPRFINSGVSAVAFNADGSLVASAGEDLTIRIWEVSTGKELRTLTGHTTEEGEVRIASKDYLMVFVGINDIAFSPDGKWLASGGMDHTARLWEVATGNEAQTLTGHTSSVKAIAFSPDSRWLASGSGDKTIRLWEVATGQEVRKLTDKE